MRGPLGFASMGPPLKAAENLSAWRSQRPRRCIASMGPPLKAAENRDIHAGRAAYAAASMGPPLKAAENSRDTIRGQKTRPALQWAAAKSSGKFTRYDSRSKNATGASMGPPLKAAENPSKVFAAIGDNTVASMGPPLKAAENVALPRRLRSRAHTLQWGRR